MMCASYKALVTLLVGCLLSLSACSPEQDAETSAELQALQAEYLQVNAQLSQRSKEKDQLEETLKTNAALLKSLDRDSKREAALAAEVAPLSNYLATLENASNTVKADLDTWRQATRNSYVGMNIPELHTNSGTIHSNVTIAEIRDERFVVEDSDGNKIEVPFADVNEAIRKALVHEPSALSH